MNTLGITPHEAKRLTDAARERRAREQEKERIEDVARVVKEISHLVRHAASAGSNAARARAMSPESAREVAEQLRAQGWDARCLVGANDDIVEVSW